VLKIRIIFAVFTFLRFVITFFLRWQRPDSATFGHFFWLFLSDDIDSRLENTKQSS